MYLKKKIWYSYSDKKFLRLKSHSIILHRFTRNNNYIDLYNYSVLKVNFKTNLL